MPKTPWLSTWSCIGRRIRFAGTYVVPLRGMAATGDGRAWGDVQTHSADYRPVHDRRADESAFDSGKNRTGGAQCRYGFTAPDGKILYDSDLQQIEMRTFAHLSRDPKLCQVFIEGARLVGDEKKLRDIHSMTASEMFGVSNSAVEGDQRQAGKAIR